MNIVHISLVILFIVSCSATTGEEASNSTEDSTQISSDVLEIDPLPDTSASLTDDTVSTYEQTDEEVVLSEQEKTTIEIEVEERNSVYKSADNPEYKKFAKHLPDFATKLPTCTDRYEEIFSASINDDPSCSSLKSRMSKDKSRMIKRCMNLEYNTLMSDETHNRLELILPRGVERIHRNYRQAALKGCIVGDVPDQSEVNYVFNGSVEVSELDGSWSVFSGSKIPGWAVRFYDVNEGVVEKKGLLEIQSNSLYRADSDSSEHRSYMELDSDCAEGYNCPTTNVSIRQKIFIEEETQFSLSFDARQRRAIEGDSVLEVRFYKKGKRAKTAPINDSFEIVRETSVESINSDANIPVSTSWETYKADLGTIEAGEYFIEINEIGTANKHGTLIDMIEIHR